MSKLPSVSGCEGAQAPGKVGLYLRRQESSHRILRRDKLFAQVIVPGHRELDRGMLRAIIRHAGPSVKEFLDLLKAAR